MSDPSTESTAAQRGIKGLGEGVLWGASIGLVRGMLKLVRGAEDPWPQMGASILFGLIVGAIICGVGRATSGKIPGAAVGAIAGLFAGLFIGYEIFDYYWITGEEVETETTSSATVIGIPLAQIISSAAGLIVGAVVGAFTEKGVRARLVSARSGGGSSPENRTPNTEQVYQLTLSPSPRRSASRRTTRAAAASCTATPTDLKRVV